MLRRMVGRRPMGIDRLHLGLFPDGAQLIPDLPKVFAVLQARNFRNIQICGLFLSKPPDSRAKLALFPCKIIGEIANELVLDRATLGHSLKPLEHEGLISFSVGDDRRARVIALTKSGIAKLEEAKPLWLRVQRRFETEFGASYSERLRRDLEKVASDCPLPA